jgi:thymidylate synthase (FAD)
MNTLDPLKDSISSVSYIDHMGSDLSVVNAARVSFNKESSFDGVDGDTWLSEPDTKLINYLAKHNHWTPFGHAQLSLRVKAPIFVARQLVKHQVGLVWNEVSRRYVSDTPEIYQPSGFRLAPEGSIKQGSSDRTSINTGMYPSIVASIVREYEGMIRNGIAPEEARMILPLATYTEWVWSGSLAAWMRVINLRCDPHSQSQTRAYGEAFASIVQDKFPVSYKALRK